MEKLIHEFSVGLFILHTIIFVGLIFLLKKFAWKPILDAVNEREENIVNSIEEAKKARMEMAELKADNDRILKEARIEREVILKEATDLKNQIIAEAKEKAHEAAAKEVEDARKQIINEKMAAQTELKNEVAALSIQIAEKVLKGELTDKAKQESLVASMINDMTLN